MSLKKKLLVFVLILVIIPQVLLGLFSYYLAKKQIAEQTKENLVQEVNNLKSNIETINQQIIELIRAQIVTIKTKAWAGLNADNLHAIIESDELTLVAGDGSKRAYKTGNNELVDYIIKNIGSDYVAGIYRFENDKAICLSTNIIKDGKRIIGAKLETEIVKKISETKEEFAGKELIDGEEYFTIYSPVFDKEHKNIIALIMVGRSISKMVDTLAANTNKIKVGETGYAYILNSKGMLVTHPSIRGKNISQYDFVQEMIKTKSGYLSYIWEKREKIVAYSYVEKNDWIIAAGSYYDEFDAVLSKLRWITIFVICLTSLVSTFVVAMLVKGIATPVAKIAEDLKNISAQVESASKQLSDASQNLSESSATQASSMEETSSSLDEIRAMVETNTQNAMQAEKLALAVKNNTERGNAAMDELILSMHEILQSNEQIEKMAKLISEIGEKTQIIDEIVFQTKLLSFNASVEAERAGEHGRGFAVVAQEVGNLAQMSGKAANEVTAIVSTSIRNAEMITKENRKKVEEGNNLVKEAASVLKDTVIHAQQVSDNSSLVVKASKEQLAGIKQINTAMSQINEITQRTAATAEESSSASEELLAQATGLSETVTILEDLVSGRKV